MPEPELHISKRLRALLPPLNDDEREQLKANIIADGRLTDPIIYWHDGKQNVIVDGMHRFDVIEETGLPFKAELIEIAGGYEEAELWILNHQLGRRNLLSPQAIRKIRGELYNRMKGSHGGDHKSEKASGHNVPLLQGAATHIAAKAGVSERTVRRDGARLDALEACELSIQKGIESGLIKVSDAEIKVLAKLPPGQQNAIALAIRKGQSPTVTAAMADLKITRPRKGEDGRTDSDGTEAQEPAPTPPRKGREKPGVPPKQYPRAHWFKQWEQAIGPLVRLVDKIAEGVGEKRCPYQLAAHDALNIATEAISEWTKVKEPTASTARLLKELAELADEWCGLEVKQ